MYNNAPQELKRRQPGFAPRTIFDIGANIGQSTADFRTIFPEARIFCFEPVAATFAELSTAVAADPLTSAYRLAFGNAEGTVRVTARRTSTGNRVQTNPDRTDGTEEVPLRQGVGFCREQGIDRIDYLKIDTEGFDLEVLLGFVPMLADRRVDVIQVECGFSRSNAYHVPFEAISGFLQPMGYGLFGLFGTSGRDHLRNRVLRGLFYGDAVFIAER